MNTLSTVFAAFGERDRVTVYTVPPGVKDVLLVD